MARRRIGWAVLLVLLIGTGGVWWGVRDTLPTIHRIRRGDTLSKLAARHQVTVEQLRRWNHIEGDLIEVGDRLLIWPARAPSLASSSDMAPAARKGSRQRSSLPPPSGRASDTGAGAPRRSTLSLPPEKPCLGGPDGTALEEGGMAANVGLDPQEAASALRAFSPQVAACLSKVERTPSSTLDLVIRVACTGRVARVDVGRRGDWPASVVDCVTDTLRYAPFPAHALPDGEEVRWPLRAYPP